MRKPNFNVKHFFLEWWAKRICEWDCFEQVNETKEKKWELEVCWWIYEIWNLLDIYYSISQ